MNKNFCLLFSLLLMTSFTKEAYGDDSETYLQNKGYNFVLSLSELTHIDLNDEFEVNWGIEASNMDQEKFELDFSYSSEYDRQVDNFDNTKTTNSSTSSNLDIDVNKIWKRLGYTSHYSLEQTKENDRYQDHYDITVGPLGVKWDVFENKYVTELSLSYYPTYGYLERFSYDLDATPSTKDVIIQRSLQHSFKFSFQLNYLDLTFKEEFTWKEVIPFDKSNANTRDNHLINTLELDLKITPHFSSGLIIQTDNDDSRKRFQKLPATVHKTSLNMSFTL